MHRTLCAGACVGEGPNITKNMLFGQLQGIYLSLPLPDLRVGLTRLLSVMRSVVLGKIWKN
jgi:hypothetical protein